MTSILILIISCNIVDTDNKNYNLEKRKARFEQLSDTTTFKIIFNSDSSKIYTNENTFVYAFNLGISYDKYSANRLFSFYISLLGPQHEQRIVMLYLFGKPLPKARIYEVVGLKNSFTKYQPIAKENLEKFFGRYIENNTVNSDWVPEDYFDSGSFEILEISSTSIKGRFEINFTENEVLSQITGEFQRFF